MPHFRRTEAGWLRLFLDFPCFTKLVVSFLWLTLGRILGCNERLGSARLWVKFSDSCYSRPLTILHNVSILTFHSGVASAECV